MDGRVGDRRQSEIKRSRVRLRKLIEKRGELAKQLLAIDREISEATRRNDQLRDYMGWNR